MATIVGDKIRLTDLAQPVLSEMQAAALAHATANPVTISEENVLAVARERTGLSDFGADDFRERLRIWIKSVNDDAELSPAGRLACYNELLRFAINRLQAEEEIRRHPAILDIDIDRPLIIAGLPRSGTTYLLQLMSADQRLRSLPHWEAVRPARTPYIKDGKDTRYDL